MRVARASRKDVDAETVNVVGIADVNAVTHQGSVTVAALVTATALKMILIASRKFE